MNPIELELSPFQNALQRLEEGYVRYTQDVSDIQIRDGLVQRFEFTYEISHKMLKRYMEMASPTPEMYDTLSFADLIRSGNEQGLLRSDWTRWKLFREMRGKTSHTYDESVALVVVAEIPDFIEEAQFLLAQLETRVR